MKYLLTLLLLFIPIKAYSIYIETTITPYYSEADTTITATGTYCGFTKGFQEKEYVVEITAGTATFDIILSPTADGIDLAGDVEEILTDSTVDAAGTYRSAARYMCIRVTACSSCSIDGKITGAR